MSIFSLGVFGVFACQIQDGWKGKVDALRDKDDEGGDVSLGQGNATVAKGQVPETKHCVPQRWKTLMSKMENIDVKDGKH